MAKKGIKIPKKRRQYYTVYALDKGLDYSKASTMIGEAYVANCQEVLFRRSRVEKATGTKYFASTNTTPLLDTVMHLQRYLKANSSDKLMAHTESQLYAYNSSSELFENITRGAVVEDCEDAWTANANVTCATDTDFRKGTKSAKNTIASGFTTGVACYENFGAADLSGYTHLHLFIKSDIATIATDLDIRVSEENAGGTGASYEDVSIPALPAGVWTEVSVAFAGATATRDAVLSVSLIVAADKGATVIHIDDVMATIETTGDMDDFFSSVVMNDYYVYSNGIAPVMYWDMVTATSTLLLGTENIGAKVIRKFGERVCLYHTVDTGAPKPQRVQWTIVGGLSTTPVATDWTDPGSGNTDLESTMVNDFIMTAEKLGSYMIIYGERTIVHQEYVGVVDDPFAFYTRVTGKGLAASRAIINLGNEHIFMGWDNIYSYKGGKEVTRIGDSVKDELFSIINPEYLHRSFAVYKEEIDEVRFYIPVSEDTYPTTYFSYNIKTGAWGRGLRSYVCSGLLKVSTGTSWDTAGASATATWDEQTERWDDQAIQALAQLRVYGDSSGVVRNDDSSEYNIDGAAIDGWIETKDFVTGEGYRRTLTNWMELQFEARGHTLIVQYSTDAGVSWSTSKTFTLTSLTVWGMYNYDFEVNSPQIRFRFRNAIADETFQARMIELGFIPASDRGV